jgi:HSP20 family protein
MLGTRAATGNGRKEALTVAQWSPLVDITEDDKEYLIKVELPDMKKEDVRLTVENEVLAISGERKFKKEENGKKYHRLNARKLRTQLLPSGGCGRGQGDRFDFKDGCSRHRPKSQKAYKTEAIEIKVAQSVRLDRGMKGVTEARLYVEYDVGVFLTCVRPETESAPLASGTASRWVSSADV